MTVCLIQVTGQVQARAAWVRPMKNSQSEVAVLNTLLLGMFFCQLLIKSRLYTVIFCCSRDSQLDTVKPSESCSFGFQFGGPKGGVPANWVFHTALFQSDEVAFLLNKWILFCTLQ